MTAPTKPARQSVLKTLCDAEESPEGILIVAVLASTAMLIAVAAFLHDTFLLIPSLPLMAGLRAYHLRRTRPMQDTPEKPASG
ncbi:MAG: hypothetical protein HY288_04145 [Planctomycetia bacterium]|nr:hypothetical protein [Planctomycetia bacterium]